MDVERLQRLFVDSLSDPRFTRTGTRTGELDVSGNCRSPVAVVRWSRSTGLAKNIRKGFKGVPMMELTFHTRCRRCAPCLQATAREWRTRAISEIGQAERTWFGTLTFRPEVHFAMDVVSAAVKADFEALPPEQKFAARATEAGRMMTLYLKRLRKNSGHAFRYLLVTERHDSVKTAPELRNRPHLHMLLHEFANQPLRKSFLEKEWPYGFSSWRLTEGNAAAFYVSKYISKAAEVRTRASLRYGLTDIERSETE